MSIYFLANAIAFSIESSVRTPILIFELVTTTSSKTAQLKLEI